MVIAVIKFRSIDFLLNGIFSHPQEGRSQESARAQNSAMREKERVVEEGLSRCGWERKQQELVNTLCHLLCRHCLL